MREVFTVHDFLTNTLTHQKIIGIAKLSQTWWFVNWLELHEKVSLIFHSKLQAIGAVAWCHNVKCLNLFSLKIQNDHCFITHLLGGDQLWLESCQKVMEMMKGRSQLFPNNSSVCNQLQFHVWRLTASKWSMIDYNRFEIGIQNLMRIFGKLLVLWNNSCYLCLSNTSGHELLKYYVKLFNLFLKKCLASV